MWGDWYPTDIKVEDGVLTPISPSGLLVLVSCDHPDATIQTIYMNHYKYCEGVQTLIWESELKIMDLNSVDQFAFNVGPTSISNIKVTGKSKTGIYYVRIGRNVPVH